MSSCTVQVVFDREGERYEAGERVAGRVRIHARAGLPGRVVRAWFACAFRNGGPTFTLRQGPILEAPLWMEKGDAREVPFGAPLPEGAFSYQGRFLGTAWMVEASVSQGEWTDASGSACLEIAPGPPSRVAPTGLVRVRGRLERERSAGATVLAAATTIGLGLASLSVARWAMGPWQGQVAIAGALSAVALGGVLVASVVLGRRADRRWRPVVELGGPAVGRGAELPVRISVARECAAQVRAELVCAEQVLNDETCCLRVIETKEIPLAPVSAESGAAGWAGTVAVPTDLPPASLVGAEGISWFVRITARGRRRAAFTDDYGVNVVA